MNTRQSTQQLWIVLTALEEADWMLRVVWSRRACLRKWPLHWHLSMGWGRAECLRQHKECKESGKGSHPNDSQNKVKIPQPYYSTVIANMWCWLAPRERGERSGNSSSQCFPGVRMCARAFVQAALFFYFLMFLMPSAASPECPSYTRQQLWSRETKGKVAIVTEASYSSLQSSSPMGGGETPSATQGPPTLGPVCQLYPFQQFLGKLLSS